MILRWLMMCFALGFAAVAGAQEEEAGHMHGPDGRHVAVASTFGATGGKQILSHHDLRIEGPDGKSIVGAKVLSIIFKRNDPNAVVHREENAYEPENEVYGSHMMYREPGEYTILESVTLPHGKQLDVQFPVWVPAPIAATEEEHAHGPNWLLIIGGPLLAIGALYAAYRAGRKAAVAGALIFVLVLGTMPVQVIAQGEKEPGHMHGPDGRHVAVASTFGGADGAEPLKAYPTADLKESATQQEGDIKFTLSIENEELEVDPDIVQMSAEVAKTVGLTTAIASLAGTSGSLVTTGVVRPNPNGAITINARASGRIVRLGVTPGQKISTGHTVAVIDSTEVAELQAEYRRATADAAQARASFTSAQSSVSAAQTRLQNAEQALKRQQSLARAGAFENPAVEVARSAVAEAEGEVREATAALEGLDATARRLKQGVEQGVVARNEAERAESAAQQGRARLQTAERQVQIARETLAREQRILSQGLRNAREVQQAEAEVRITRAGVQSARSQLAEARASQVRASSSITSAADRLRQLGARPGGGTQVVHAALIGGEVVSRPVSPGQTVEAGATLATILNTSTVWIEGDVFERDLQRVRVGQPVSVTADAVPGQTFQGVVEYISGEVNPETRAVRVRTVVRQSREVLKPNMFARVILGSGGTSSALVSIPAEALQEDAGSQIVFVETEPGSYRRTVVQVSSTAGDSVLLSSGVNPGAKVVTRGAYQLLAKVKGG